VESLSSQALPDTPALSLASGEDLPGVTLVVDRPELERLRGELEAGQVGTPEQLQVRVLAERLSLVEAFDRLLALEQNRIEEFPHQIEATLRVLREMRGRALLADEVGLGKTIEAGMVMKEYLVRGMVRTVLILTPPALMRQWQEELAGKFLEEVPLADRPADWTRFDRVIGSLDTAKQARHAEKILSRPWDLVIVDEAHRVRNSETLGWKLVNRIQRRYLLLLTATPVQNDLRELYNLITLLRPGQLGGYRSFRSQFVDPKDPRQPLNPTRLRGLLSECMVRNRRSLVTVKFPPRHAFTHTVQLSSSERELYERVAALSRGQHLHGKEALVRLLLLQEACSSPDAVGATLRQLASREPALHDLAARAELVDDCAKAEAVVRIARDVGDRVLVFTEFRETQERLKRRLEEAGLEAALFHGGLSRGERAESVRRFFREVRVLISTESGAEGHNLQFCNVLVNFDLPWNPMRLEQRIGRLHRLGQERDVYVFNLAAAETVEADLLELLTSKIRMFELVVGELDLILGLMADQTSFEQTLARMWLESDDLVQYRQELTHLGERIREARQRYAGVQEAELFLSRVFDEAQPGEAKKGRTRPGRLF
jgi:SNF2 family DNA or RNA helicase